MRYALTCTELPRPSSTSGKTSRRNASSAISCVAENKAIATVSQTIESSATAGDKKPSANFDYAGPLTEAVLLGCLASAFPNETLQWDAPALKIPNNAAADKFVHRDYRKGWEIV